MPLFLSLIYNYCIHYQYQLRSNHMYNQKGQSNQFILDKQKEEQRYSCILQQWKEARIHFFTYRMGDILQKAGVASKKQQKFIAQLFINYQQEINSKLQNAQKCKKFKKQIRQLHKAENQLQSHYQNMLRQCTPFQQIIQLRCLKLKVIKIQYSPKDRFEDMPFQLSAFSFFKVVYENTLLTEVTIKSVRLLGLEDFIYLINPSNRNDIDLQGQEEYEWVLKFNSRKCLKLSFNHFICFRLYQNDLSLLNNLMFSVGLFQSLSDITVHIELGEWGLINLWIKDLLIYWQCLRKINRIKLQIEGYSYQISFENIIPVQCAQVVRSSIFGELAVFKNISSLTFIRISFNKQFQINDLLAMEQSLNTVFINNKISHLTLHRCSLFPCFETPLHSIQMLSLSWVSFRGQFSIVSKVCENNGSLRHLEFDHIQQSWKIDGRSFDQLDNLCIQDGCQFITLGNSQPQTPSNIKSLTLHFSRIDCIPIFPKLVSLAYLSTQQVNYGYALLRTIPSIHLQQLSIYNNSIINDRDVKEIDAKWPYLRKLTLRKCTNITDNIWSICLFKGMMDLSVDHRLLGESQKALSLLKTKGIKVNYY